MKSVSNIKKILKTLDLSSPDLVNNPKKYFTHLADELKKISPLLAGRLNDILQNDNPDVLSLEKIIHEINILVSSNKSIRDSFQKLAISIENIDGVGPKTASTLKKNGIETLQDVILHFPYKYELVDTDLQSEKLFITGVLASKNVIKTKHGKSIFQAVFKCADGYYYGIWFNFSRKYPDPVLRIGKEYSLYGKYTNFNGKPSVIHPAFMDKSDRGQVKTYYSLPGNVKNQSFVKIVRRAFAYIGNDIIETLPEKIITKYDFPGIKNALHTIHFPERQKDIRLLNENNHPAFIRFVYEELFYLQLGLLIKKSNYNKVYGIKYDVKQEYLDDIKKYIPFKLTTAQRRVLADIFNDMKSEHQMNRLLQGDVGSGKTIVAFISALVAVKNGYQAAIIAPTEVLSEQHFINLIHFLKNDYTVSLLTGSTPKNEKHNDMVNIKEGNIDFVVGTHAVIRDDVEFKNLGFAIIDEQHRFGVLQRKNLVDKGYNPDILLMTATPIPRTLSLTFYGDLNVSIIDEMPPGRSPVKTKSFSANNFDKVLELTEEELQKGNRAYFIYPLIDESEKIDLKDATKNFEYINSRFSSYNVALLHGRMKASDKNSLMTEFKNGNIDVLVSTTVVEVGVDVPDATVMVIENAERFGLSQLHQLRGRVGRSNKKSYCYLVYSDKISDDGKTRLNSMVTTNDGFKLSEVDLEIRGPGDFFGTRQSGLPEFRFSNIVRDVPILNKARNDADTILQKDPFLEKPEHIVLKEILHFRWKQALDLTNIG
ncbi:MAG: ATP-dependent DNA helicase RecG [Flexistipes sinusarabici]|uniref:ATP-dependent DNA helicase RecG n=1 Tax=Flexistipes sinusarabici TaxID=2352 RepID=A0A5D0MWL4_FLESI|nr:ATP-dependent DNA helicase RecG [Flexistipes sinusarabici]TYB36458.1 MAG: ATP-dependent DNA helicase RecG [Flexistipes sinusarabici]